MSDIADGAEHVLVVGFGDAIGSRLRALRSGSRLTLLTDNTTTVDDATTSDFDLVVTCNHSQPTTSVSAARAIHSEAPVTSVVHFGEHAMTAASLIAQELGLRGPDPDVVTRVVDKLAMRRALSDADADPTRTWQDVHDVPNLREIGAVVVKPRGSSGSRGVTVVHSNGGLAAAADTALRHQNEVPGYVIETFHPGPLYSVDSFSQNGTHVVLFTSQEFITPRTCVERGYVMPAPVAADREQALVACATRALDVLGVRDGATHTELVWTDGGPRLIETHLRPAADRYVELVEEMLSIDLIDVTIRQQLGEEVLDAVREAVVRRRPDCGAAAVWFASPRSPGRVVKVLRPQTTPEAVVVEALRLNEDYEGDVDNLARVASVTVRADSPAAALHGAREAASELRFVLVVGPADEDGADPDVVRP